MMGPTQTPRRLLKPQHRLVQPKLHINQHKIATVVIDKMHRTIRTGWIMTSFERELNMENEHSLL